jgi:hypothetical protein
MPGAATSEVEVTNISKHGFWLLIDGRELSSGSRSSRGSSKRRSTRSSGLNVRPQPTSIGRTSTSTFSMDSIAHPERFPLKSRPAGRCLPSCALSQPRWPRAGLASRALCMAASASACRSGERSADKQQRQRDLPDRCQGLSAGKEWMVGKRLIIVAGMIAASRSRRPAPESVRTAGRPAGQG